MPRPPMTLTQKILGHHAIGLARPWVAAGDLLRVRVDWTIASELAWNGMDRTYTRLGRPPLAAPDRFFLTVDHTVDPVTLRDDPRAQRLARLAREFAAERGVVHFHDANQTILHTRFYRDLVEPGQLVIGADSHTSSHGGLGAFAIGLGGADVAVAMVLGETWIEVPEAIAVEYRGAPPFGVGGKDVVLRTLGLLRRNTSALERSVEYRGEAVAGLSTDDRFTIANMTAELGGLNGIFEADAQAAALLGRREGHRDEALWLRADEDAPYVARHRVELDALAPQVARPSSPDNVVDVGEVAGTAVDGVFIGACTTTESDLVLAGLLLEAALGDGRRPAPSARRLVVPGDLDIARRLDELGLWAAYERAGFRVGAPGCSMCLAAASDRAAPGETWLSSQNRNFPDRMGEGSRAFLASPATVAASSFDLRLADPRPLLERIDRERLERMLRRGPRGLAPEVTLREPILEVGAAGGGGADAAGGEPRRLRGRVQRFGDHVDTDAIIPGEFCHLTSVEQLGDHCFHHQRPGFAARARAGASIVVAGRGWGTGSSREQAAWALQGAGVIAVVARSFAFIHRRNLVNEALVHLQVEDDELYALADEGCELEVDPRGEVVHCASGRRFTARERAPMALALEREGGLVPAIVRHGAEVFAKIVG